MKIKLFINDVPGIFDLDELIKHGGKVQWYKYNDKFGTIWMNGWDGHSFAYNIAKIEEANR